MLVEQTIEIDLPQQGNCLIAPIMTTMNVIKCGASLVATFIGMAITEWRRPGSRISRTAASKPPSCLRRPVGR